MLKLLERCLPPKIPRSVITQFLCNFSRENDKREPTEKKENIPSEAEIKSNDNITQVKKESSDVASDSDLQWRTPWHKKEGEHYSYLRILYTDKTKRNLLQMMEAPITWESVKDWLKKKNEDEETGMQSYLPERHNLLGNELAAAHFIVYRGGAIKFFDEDRWIKADDNNNYTLPDRYQSNKILQGIDCSYMNIRYEGLENLAGLKQVEWLSFNGCRYIDDWCLDKISNIFSRSLIYLDLRDCPNFTERGLGALYKMRNLKILLLDDLWKDTIYELTCLLLQEVNPSLDVRSKL